MGEEKNSAQMHAEYMAQMPIKAHADKQRKAAKQCLMLALGGNVDTEMLSHAVDHLINCALLESTMALSNAVNGVAR
jgi:hypothetical protein